MSPQFEIQLIAVFIAAACALPGAFLVLRKMAMMADSISHTILLGIVLSFFVVHDLSSPLLIVGAAIMGVLTVWLTELTHKTHLVKEDCAIGIVFPLLFSVAVILISRYTSSIHLDTDSVLLGELAFAPFDRLIVSGVDIGAKPLYIAGILLFVNLLLAVLFFKELKLVTFDPVLAAVMGFCPALIHYGLMTMVSMTAVASFQAVGSVLAVAFMIGPPATAYLLTDDLKYMLALSAGAGALSALLGYRVAYFFDVSIAGSMAVMVGILFAITFIFAPERGLVSIIARKQMQKRSFLAQMLLQQCCKRNETTIQELYGHIHLPQKKIYRLLKRLQNKNYIRIDQMQIYATDIGKEYCKQSLENLI